MRTYQGEVPGACVAVLHGGAPILRRAYGLADLEAGVAATAATDFRLASLTKQFTAAAILLLQQDGRVGVEDSVRQWLPGLPVAADGMAIRHLLAHTSGLIDYEDLIPEGTTLQLRDADVLRLLEAEDRPTTRPSNTDSAGESPARLDGIRAKLWDSATSSCAGWTIASPSLC